MVWLFTAIERERKWKGILSKNNWFNILFLVVCFFFGKCFAEIGNGADHHRWSSYVLRYFHAFDMCVWLVTPISTTQCFTQFFWIEIFVYSGFISKDWVKSLFLFISNFSLLECNIPLQLIELSSKFLLAIVV